MPDRGKQTDFEAALTPEAYNSAWRYALVLATNQEDAEDLLQEALIRAFQGHRQLRDPACFTSWLLAIVRRAFLDQRRRMRAQPPLVDELPLIAVDGVTHPLAETTAAVLAQLPASQRELLCLFYLEGLTLKEMGRVLSLSPLVIRKRLYRARQSMRARLHAPHNPMASVARLGGDCHETN